MFYQFVPQQKRDKSFNIGRVPKFESVVGILDHLAATHRAQISEAVRAMGVEVRAAVAVTLTSVQR